MRDEADRKGGRAASGPGARRGRDAEGLRVLAIFGPTASGKSAVAEAVARQIPADLVAVDSAQLYRGLPTLTNQSPAALVGIWPLDYEATVAEFQTLAHAAIDATLEAGRTPVVVGGTGLYFRAALAELEVPPAPAPGARERWGALYDESPEHAYTVLADVDPKAAAAVHPNDRRRVVRALELAETGHSLRGDRLWAGETRRPTTIVGLEVPPTELERRIVTPDPRECSRRASRRKCDAPSRGRSRRPHARSWACTRSASSHEGRQRLRSSRRTRQLAAYQRKWMRRIPGLVSVRADRSPDEVADDVLALARGGQRVPAGRES